MTQNITVSQMELELTNSGFFVGGLTDEAIDYYYKKLFQNKLG
jgi:hypothetical protein